MRDDERLALRKFLAPEFVFGWGARHLIAQNAKNYFLSRVLLVTDEGLLATGWPQEVGRTLEEAGISPIIYSEVSPNPLDKEVQKGAERFRSAGCSGIVVVGGGSPIDCAKGIGIIASNGGSILDYVGIARIPLPSPPLLCIPTTAGSAADISPFAIITDSQNKTKTVIVSRALVPDISLVDPEVTTTMPLDVTASSGMDALTHAIEAIVSNANAPITDLFALETARLIRQHLVQVIREPQAREHCNGMMLASLYAGLAFSNASLGLVHAMAHSLGGLLDISHGECNGILLDPVVRYNYEAASEAYVRFAKALGLDLGEAPSNAWKEPLLAEISRIVTACGITKKLSGYGLKRRDIPQLSKSALQDPCLVTNPRSATLSQIEELYEQAF